jgi:PucR C-terminal helix-turn-helix domain/GGDEF-like domain
VAAIGLRLLDRVDALATELSEEIRRAEPFYDAGTVPAADLRASVRDNLVHILSQLAGRPMPGLEPPRATGRRRAEQGVPLPVVLHAYRVAGQFIWDAILAEAEGDATATTELLRTGSELWLIIDTHSGSITDSYRDTVAERALGDAQTRSAMLDALLRGDNGDGSRLWESATTLRLPQRGTFVVVAARPPGPGVEAVPRAEQSLRAHGLQSSWRVEVDSHLGVVVLTPRTGIDALCGYLLELSAGPVGVSTPYPTLDRTPAALRQARLALAAAAPVADRAGGDRLVRYERAPIQILLASAPDAAGAVAQAVLGPVLALPAAERDTLLGTLRTWFEEHGATSAAATRLYVHRNTVRYRLRRVEELTGRSLAQPTGIAELHLAMEAARIVGDGRPPPAA